MDVADLERRFVERLLDLSAGAAGRSVLVRISEALLDAIDGDRVFVLIFRKSGGFRCLVARDRDREEITDPEERVSHFAVGRMFETGEVFVVPDARTDRRFRSVDALEGRRLPISVWVFPLHVDGAVAGAVYVDHRFRRLDSRWAADPGVQRWVALLACALSIRHRDRRARWLEKELRQQSRHGPSESAMDSRFEFGKRGKDDDVAAHVAGAWRERECRDFHGIRSCNPDMLDLFETLSGIATSDLPVLIAGETGVGKGRLAHAVHLASTRKRGPFVAVGCASIPDSLVESELLGHARGAFTGAEADRVGLIEQADCGTLFLDEIGDMSPAMQRLLLRVLEDGIVRPLGARKSRQVDLRVVASSSRDVEQLVARGEFRRDLYFRLKGLVVTMPPLRERWEDVPALVDAILSQIDARGTEIKPEALEALARYPWPGNVRELENELRRWVALGVDPVEVSSLSPSVRGRPGEAGSVLGGAAGGVHLETVLDEVEHRTVREALRRTSGNKSRAAEMLGITRKALYRRLEKYGLAASGGRSRVGREASGEDEPSLSGREAEAPGEELLHEARVKGEDDV